MKKNITKICYKNSIFIANIIDTVLFLYINYGTKKSCYFFITYKILTIISIGKLDINFPLA